MSGGIRAVRRTRTCRTLTPNRINPTATDLDLMRSGRLSAGRIAAEIGRHVSVVERWARELGISLPDQHAHRVDAEFFRTWSPSMAYVLGFIAADGCVRKSSDTKGDLEITLSSVDRELLVAIRRVMSIDRGLRDSTGVGGHPRTTLAIGSIRLVEDLISLGIGPRKSATLEWPRELPAEFAAPFVLGYFDGDGSVDIARRSNHGHRYERLRFRLTGTYAFLEALADTAWQHTGWLGNLSQDRRSANVWTLSYVGSGAEAFGTWMYEAAVPQLHLGRKREVFDKYTRDPNLREHRKGKLSFDDAEAIRAAWATGKHTQRELGVQYGVTPSNISAIVCGRSMVRRYLIRS